VKATMPLFTVLLSRIIFNERHSTKVYVSLFPIILGVTIATMTEFNFDLIGLLSALFATFGFSLQNIFSKSVLKQTGIHQFQLLQTLAKLSLLLFLPFWLVIDVRSFFKRTYDVTPNYESIFILLFIDGLLNFLQNVLAFSVLNVVSPLTYSVANASKRIFIILVSLFFFGNQVGVYNFLGIFIAVAGVFLYNKAKHEERNQKNYIPLFNNNYI
jgi:solute carrier family 35 protein E1